MRSKTMGLFVVSSVFAVMGLVLVLAFSARASETKKPGKAALGITLQVNGMVCSECAKKVESCLMKVKGVKKVSVDVDENRAYVEYDAKKASVSKMIKALKKKGYDAKKEE